MQVGPLCLEPVAFPQRAAQFDLALFLAESQDRLIGALEYNTDLFDQATIGRLAHHFHHVLEAIVADPDQQLSRCP